MSPNQLSPFFIRGMGRYLLILMEKVFMTLYQHLPEFRFYFEIGAFHKVVTVL